MTTPDLWTDPVPPLPTASASPSRLLASAMLHVLDRDEPLPARWRAEPFVTAVEAQRAALEAVTDPADLDRLVPTAMAATFRAAVANLASDPHAAAIAVRRLELARRSSLPTWQLLLRHGIGPRVGRDDAARWFG